jgi:hypothetical protein
MAALVLRIKFPVTYPLIYKTLRVDANFTVHQAVRFIAETVNVTGLLVGSEGLYIPDEAQWLDDNTILSTYKTLQEAVCELIGSPLILLITRNILNLKIETKNLFKLHKLVRTTIVEMMMVVVVLYSNKFFEKDRILFMLISPLYT